MSRVSSIFNIHKRQKLNNKITDCKILNKLIQKTHLSQKDDETRQMKIFQTIVPSFPWSLRFSFDYRLGTLIDFLSLSRVRMNEWIRVIPNRPWRSSKMRRGRGQRLEGSMSLAKGQPKESRRTYFGGAREQLRLRGFTCFGQWVPTITVCTTLRRFLFRPHCPRQHMPALYSSSTASLVGQTSLRIIDLPQTRISITRRRVHRSFIQNARIVLCQ